MAALGETTLIQQSQLQSPDRTDSLSERVTRKSCCDGLSPQPPLPGAGQRPGIGTWARRELHDRGERYHEDEQARHAGMHVAGCTW